MAHFLLTVRVTKSPRYGLGPFFFFPSFPSLPPLPSFSPPFLYPAGFGGLDFGVSPVFPFGILSSPFEPPAPLFGPPAMSTSMVFSVLPASMFHRTESSVLPTSRPPW